MPRKVNGTSGHSVEKHGEGIGGGPVGSSGGYAGRPGGNSHPQGGNAPQQQGEDRGLGGSSSSGLGKAAALGAAAYLINQAAKNSSSNSQSHTSAQSSHNVAPGNAGPGGGGGNNRKSGGGLSLKKIIIIAIAAIVIISLLKSCNTSYETTSYTTTTTIATQVPVVQTPTPAATTQSQSYGSSSSGYAFDINSLLGGSTSVNSGITSSGWVQGSNSGTANTAEASSSAASTTATTVSASGMRDKFYTPSSGDKTTIMIYMCGTDLESGSGMATSDLQEMAAATISDDVNLLVYAGGCSGWKNNLMSSSTNTIYQIMSGGKFKTLADAGNVAMTKPSTLAEYIQFCAKNFPAERNILILWDHGGGSITGYGYDQKFQNAGSMSLAGIDEALKAGGVKFDFIGFDACLMATAETALMCSDYADYLVASEESEPGIGWYYTNWLTKLSNNTAVSTVELGQKIVDDFVDVCAQKCRGQDTTLSVVDLAELSATLPDKLADFSSATTAMIQNNQYKTVATARGSSKEFAASSKIDQVDLAHLAYNLNTDAGNALAQVIRSAVKYNRTSSSVQNAYGLSIYFPYRSVSSVKSAVSTYESIGMDSEYSRCIQAYATYASSGQGASGGYSSAFGSLFGSSYGYGSSDYSSYGSSSSYSSSSYSDYSDIYSLLSQMMYGRSLGNVKGLTSDNSSFISDTFSDGTLDAENVAQFITDNQFNASNLVWTTGDDGTLQMSLPEDQWALVEELMLNLFLDDGEGYIDMGLDINSDYFTQTGALNGTFDGVWMSINDDWNCAFYIESIVNDENGCTAMGRIPVLYNGQRANLIVEIVNDEPSIVGVRYDYINGETGTIAKSVAYREGDVEFTQDGEDAVMPQGSDDVVMMKADDEIVLVADYYDYNNNYQDSYRISDTITVGDGLTVGYIYLADPDTANACFRFTDIYGQTYWTPVMSNAE